MTLTVCFDALGTCFGVEVLIDAVEEVLGDKLRAAGSDSRMVVMDWVSVIHLTSRLNTDEVVL
jgi:2-haloacid dehalogenase